MLLVPSLKPMRLRGVAWPVLVVDVRPKPSCDQRMTTVPRPMRAKLRMTWNATCGSLEQAWTQRSPPLRAGSSASPGRAGRSASAAGRLAARPKRLSNRLGPKPTVMVSPPGGRPSASPVSTGGDCGWAFDGADRQAGGHPAGRCRPGAEHDSAGRRRSCWSRRKPRTPAGPAPAWRCRPDARRRRPPMSHRPKRFLRPSAVVLGFRRDPVADTAGGDGPRYLRARQRAGRAGSGRPTHQELTTLPATFDSGSLTACSAWAIARVSAAVSWVNGTKPPMADARGTC